jgi:hypothetical protein
MIARPRIREQVARQPFDDLAADAVVEVLRRDHGRQSAGWCRVPAREGAPSTPFVAAISSGLRIRISGPCYGTTSALSSQDHGKVEWSLIQINARLARW